MHSTFENSGKQTDANEFTVRLLSPAECRDLIVGISSYKHKGSSLEGKRLVILDVRTAQEYRAGHLMGSINLDFRSPSFSDELKALDRNNAYLVYCRTGVRSSRAAALMKSLGFPEIYDLSGGMVSWLREGFGLVSNGEAA
ncbi:MAG: molybdopterin biosynthesis protein MoeB [Methanosaeta sp. PtaU1.Bin112]|nr:MAG: molybdopterin biosynthesis protein MoeB [Methanosaeta sp. PtaU1.Bin112]